MRLTIDLAVQRAAERALRLGIETARANKSYNANGGAIVALDPRDGAVLAMASYPTYKPSVYVGRVDPEKIAPLVDNEAAKDANYPGLNRVTQVEYPPGSTWKPVTALAAMQEHLLSPYQSIQCTPQAEYGLDKQVFKNWDPYVNRPMTLYEALATSCDTYFYDVGYRFYTGGRERLGSPAGLGARVRASAHPPGSTSAARPTGSCPRRPGASAPSRATGTAPGTPATRSSSRSGRRTSP